MRILLFALLFFITNYGMAHKYYVSIADLSYNEEKGIIEAYLKITAHDLERILTEEFKEKVALEEVADTSIIGLHIQKYLSENFELYSDGKKAELNYLGKEVTLRDELFIYFSFSSISDPTSIKIKSNLLYEYFRSQQNIVHYKYKGETKSVTLTVAKKEDEIQFD